MQMTSAFQNTRKNVIPVQMIQLSEDLIKLAYRNIELTNNGEKSSRYHFHVINSRDIAVTVKLTKYNNISVRGKIVNKLDDLYKVIESIKD